MLKPRGPRMASILPSDPIEERTFRFNLWTPMVLIRPISVTTSIAMSSLRGHPIANISFLGDGDTASDEIMHSLKGKASRREASHCLAPTEMRPLHKYPFAPLVYFYKEMI